MKPIRISDLDPERLAELEELYRTTRGVRLRMCGSLAWIRPRPTAESSLLDPKQVPSQKRRSPANTLHWSSTQSELTSTDAF